MNPRTGRFAKVALAAATGVIAAAIIPWGDFQDHPHWEKVGWIPFASPPLRLRDIVANVLLFAPLGASIGWGASPSAMLRAAATAGALSFAGEALQLFSHSRFPSATDVTANVCGALIGALLASRRWRM